MHSIFAERFKEAPLQDTHKTKHQGSQQQARIIFCNLISDQIEQKPAFVNNIWLVMKHASICQDM